MMVGAVTNTSTTTVAASSGTTSGAAQLKAELAAKQAALSQAKTDDDKTKINAEITKLKAAIAKLETSASSGSSDSKTERATDASATLSKVQVSPADRTAPESKVSSAAMDVLMQFVPRGGAGGPPDISQLYAELDADEDGKLSKEEFVDGSAGKMNEAQASSLFASMDSENTGSINKDQLAENMMRAGPPPMGPPPGAMAQAEAAKTTTAS